jgi:hypothetical protein
MLTYLIYVCSLLSVGDGEAGSGRLALKMAPASDLGGSEVRSRGLEPSEDQMPRIAPKGSISVGMSHGISFQH